jgi:hypothetical protein
VAGDGGVRQCFMTKDDGTLCGALLSTDYDDEEGIDQR